MKQHSNKIVLVTGAAKGIGREIARAYLADGATVILADIDCPAGEEACLTPGGGGDPAVFLFFDAGEEESCEALFRQIKARFGRLDILINNAAIASSVSGLWDAGLARFDEVLRVNLRGPFLCSKLAFPMMPPGSSIINISSTRAFMSEPNTESYSASKGGIIALTHAMAMTLGEKGIRVNSISPGWIETGGHPEDLTAADHAQHPVGRVGEPADIAAACLFLSGPQTGFITGENLTVDGGMTKKMIYVE